MELSGGFLEASAAYPAARIDRLDIRLTDVMTLRFGYRALQMDFEEDQFVLDAIVQGYVIGVSFAL